MNYTQQNTNQRNPLLARFIAEGFTHANRVARDLGNDLTGRSLRDVDEIRVAMAFALNETINDDDRKRVVNEIKHRIGDADYPANAETEENFPDFLINYGDFITIDVEYANEDFAIVVDVIG